MNSKRNIHGNNTKHDTDNKYINDNNKREKQERQASAGNNVISKQTKEHRHNQNTCKNKKR